jgi:hypothetical protein
MDRRCWVDRSLSELKHVEVEEELKEDSRAVSVTIRVRRREAVEEHRAAENACMRDPRRSTFTILSWIEGVIPHDVVDPVNPRSEWVHREIIRGDDLMEGAVLSDDKSDVLERLTGEAAVRVILSSPIRLVSWSILSFEMPASLREALGVEEVDGVIAPHIFVGEEDVVPDLLKPQEESFTPQDLIEGRFNATPSHVGDSLSFSEAGESPRQAQGRSAQGLLRSEELNAVKERIVLFRLIVHTYSRLSRPSPSNHLAERSVGLALYIEELTTTVSELIGRLKEDERRAISIKGCDL